MGFNYDDWIDDQFRDLEDRRIESERQARIGRLIDRVTSTGKSRLEAEEILKGLVRALKIACKTESQAQAALDKFLASEERDGSGG